MKFILQLVYQASSLLRWERDDARGFETRYDMERSPQLSMTRRRLLVVGSGPLGRTVGHQIGTSGRESLSLAGFVDEVEPENDLPLLGTFDELKNVIEKHQVTDVVITLPHSADYPMTEIVACLIDMPVGIWIALGFSQPTLYHTEFENFVEIPVVDLRATSIDGYKRILKRVFDVTFGLLLLLPALPLMGIFSLLILLEDGQPAIFRQDRVGENGRLFKMLKFRTMVRNAEELKSHAEKLDQVGNLIYKMKNDPRITHVGRFLRRFSLDELPQLFNILAGTMSLVGPRPEIPYLVDRYQPWQWQRFTVPPGLTGWWQVSGRSERPMHLHTEDDLYYIQNYSILLDLKILFRTVWAVLEGRGSY
jgi:exopolysaccharide biosynthesis polyprenyl glycosylphosphotransferase